jgi:dihydroxyacetone kinase-like protein
MVQRLLAEVPDGSEGRVSVLVNSLGATPLEELFILYRRVREVLGRQGFAIDRPLVGHYVTSMEMAGCSISLFHIDRELAPLLSAPARCPFWTV